MKKTKIVTTLGPSSNDGGKIEKMMRAGVDVFRLNLKHSDLAWHKTVLDLIRKTEKKTEIKTAVMVDIENIREWKNLGGADLVALSNVKQAKEIEKLKKIMKKTDKPMGVVAKIETKEAVENIDKIMAVAEGVMIARGDLGKALPLTELAYWQKVIIDKCRRANVPVIVATEMLLSMVESLSPSRAEATDVANAVFDGADGLMLSEETAIGKHPVESVEQMVKIVEFCESKSDFVKKKEMLKEAEETEILVKAAVDMVEFSQKSATGRQEIRAVVVFTESGKTARIMSSFRVSLPILAVSNNRATTARLKISYGIIPYFGEFDNGRFDIENPFFESLRKAGYFGTGDRVLVIHGNNWLNSGSTSNISIKTV